MSKINITPALEMFEELDMPGNGYVDAFGLDVDGNQVAIRFSCGKDNCSCMGSWIEGNSDSVHTWITRPQV